MPIKILHSAVQRSEGDMRVVQRHAGGVRLKREKEARAYKRVGKVGTMAQPLALQGTLIRHTLARRRTDESFAPADRKSVV